MFVLAFRRDGFESSKPTFQCYVAKTKENGNYMIICKYLTNTIY